MSPKRGTCGSTFEVRIQRLFDRILSWVRGNGVELHDEAGRTVEPNIGELSLALRGSKAFRFVENPDMYLRRLKLGGLDDA